MTIFVTWVSPVASVFIKDFEKQHAAPSQINAKPLGAFPQLLSQAHF
jgi:hypothetical protein